METSELSFCWVNNNKHPQWIYYEVILNTIQYNSKQLQYSWSKRVCENILFLPISHRAILYWGRRNKILSKGSRILHEALRVAIKTNTLVLNYYQFGPGGQRVNLKYPNFAKAVTKLFEIVFKNQTFPK